MKTMVTTRSVLSRVQFETKWSAISDSLAEAFRMTDSERTWLKNKPVAQLIAAIPLMAGCQDAERTAVAHLGTYLLSIKETKTFFNANASDDADIFERLRLGSTFVGGDKGVIDKGMSMLALCMVIDYARDGELDRKLGKHNPVSTGAFDYVTIRRDLEQRIAAVECPEMEGIVRNPETQDGWWGFDALPWEF